MADVSVSVPLVKRLLASKLVTPEQLQACQAALGADADEQRVVQELVRQGLITSWQAHRLRAGSETFFLGKYKLLSLLGQGGMGAVFKAEHAAMGRIVALKVMSSSVTKDPAAVARFQREIQAASILSHPHIVHAYDADFVSNTHFLVMEFVPGEDLESLAKRMGSLPVGTACEYIRQAALGLQHAFERGMAHRDIKPANLLLSRSAAGEPVVKILDMGLARLASGTAEDGGLTRTGQIMGTPDYIAPEQAADTRNADIRSDIFSLGCTLFRLLTGQVPYAGNSVMEKLMARAIGEARRARSLRGDLPAALDDIIARMLARDPAQRFQTPQQVVDALTPFSDAHPTLVASPAPAARANVVVTVAQESDSTAAPATLQPELADFLQNLASEAAAEEETAQGGLGSGTGADRGETSVPRQKAATVSRTVTRLQQQGEQQRRKDRRRLLRALFITLLVLLPLAGYAMWHSSGQTSLDIVWPLEERTGAELAVDGKNRPIPPEAEFSLTGVAGRRRVQLERKGYEPIEQSWTMSRGERISYRPEWRPTKETVRSVEFAELKVAANALESPGKALPHNSPQLAELQDRLRDFRMRWPGTVEGLRAARLVADLPGASDALRRDRIDPEELRACGEGNVEQAPTEIVAILGDSRWQQVRPIHALAFSPDGRWLASACGDAAVKIWDVATGRVQQIMTDGYFATLSLEFTPDGKSLIAGADVIRLWDMETGKPRKLEGPQFNVSALALNREATRLISGDTSGKLCIRDLPAGNLLHTLEAHDPATMSLAFRSDGKVFASGSWDTTVKLWDASTGALLHTIRPGESRVKGIAFPANGRLLATASDNGLIQLWDSDSGTEVRQLKRHEMHAFAVTFLGDGQRLASGEAYRNRIIFWETSSTSPLHTLNLGGDECSIMCLAATADGGRLAAGDNFGRIRLFDTTTWKELSHPSGHHGPVRLVVQNPNGRTLASAGSDRTVRLWDLADGRLLHTSPQPAAITSLAFSPEGDALAIATTSNEPGKDLRLLNPQTHDYWKTELPAPRPRTDVIFSPEGRGFVCTDNQLEAVLFDHHSSQELRKIPVVAGNAAISPNGQILATAHRDLPEVRLWNLSNGSALRTIDVKTPHVQALDFTRDGKYLATITNNTTPVQFWETGTGKPKLLLEAAGDVVQSMAFSPDGQFLAASGGEADGLLRVWELRSGKLLQTLRLTGTLYNPLGHNALTFMEDSRHIVTANNNGTLYVVRIRERKHSGAGSSAE